MNTLPESYENWYAGWKNHADSEYDSQFAHRVIPDYKPLMGLLCHKYFKLIFDFISDIVLGLHHSE